MYLSPVVKQIDLGIDKNITYSLDLADGRTIYCFDGMNDMLIHNPITNEKVFVFKSVY